MVFAILISPSIFVSYFSYVELYEQLTKQTYDERKKLADQMAFVVESRIQASTDVGKISAADIADLVEEGKWPEAVQKLKNVRQEFPHIDRIFLTDTKCTTVAYYPPSPENTGKDFRFRDWCKGLMQNGWKTTYVSEVFKRAPYPQLNSVAVMSPIKNSKGIPIGAVGFAINLELFGTLVKNFKVDKGGFLYIVNNKGQIVAHPKYPAHEKIVSYSSLPIVQKIQKGSEGVEINYNSIEKEERLAAYTLVPQYGWGVVVTDPISTAFIERDNAMRSIYLFDGFIILLNALFAASVIFVYLKLQKTKVKLDQKKLALEDANSKLQELDKLKDDFVSMASHQLRTPLTAINWYTELLGSDKNNPLNKEQRGYVQQIAIGSKRMVEMVIALLNVSRIELGTFAVDPKSTDIISIMQTVVEELQPLIIEKRLRVTTKMKDEIPQIMVDPNLFRMIYQNLLTNAVKYTPDNGSVSIYHALQGENVFISVYDTGYGIPKEEQQKIFSKLFRAENVQAKDTQGTGLGLYIIKSIIEQSGGKIWFDSPYTITTPHGKETIQGTAFYVLFPLQGMKKKEGSKPLEVKK